MRLVEDQGTVCSIVPGSLLGCWQGTSHWERAQRRVAAMLADFSLFRNDVENEERTSSL
jgi:hypothetical protein